MSSAEVAEKSGPKFDFVHPKFKEGPPKFFGAFVNPHHFRTTGQVWLGIP